MRKVLSLVLAGMFLVSGCAYAWPGGWGHDRYEYRGGHYWLGGAIVGGLVAGAIVASLDRPRVVVIDGANYYYDGTYYYTSTPNGYVVVNPPVAVVQPVVNKVIYRGQEYLVYPDGRWFIQGASGLIEVRDPTR
jgi:hypothetical protein